MVHSAGVSSVKGYWNIGKSCAFSGRVPNDVSIIISTMIAGAKHQARKAKAGETGFADRQSSAELSQENEIY